MHILRVKENQNGDSMNCFIWILLLLGCGGNCGNNNCTRNTSCGNYSRCNNFECGCNSCNNVCENMIQPRNDDDCGCGCKHHHHHHHDNECMTPPPVPRYVMQDDDCGCNN